MSEQEKPVRNRAADLGCLSLIVLIVAIVGYGIYWIVVRNNEMSALKDEAQRLKQEFNASPSQPTPSAELGTGKTLEDAYYILHVAFEGSPSEKEVKRVVARVLLQHNEPITYKSILGLGNAMVVARKASQTGVTEMEILKHMDANAVPKLSLAEQAGLSAALLEK